MVDFLDCATETTILKELYEEAKKKTKKKNRFYVSINVGSEEK